MQLSKVLGRKRSCRTGKEKYSGANIGDKWGYINGNGTPLYIKIKDEIDNGQLKLI